MVFLVDPSDIVNLVGRPRHPSEHWGRVVTADSQVYVLHSSQCVDRSKVLGETVISCLYSHALDDIDEDLWPDEALDTPVLLEVDSQCRLVPVLP